jgi:multidrug efflux pump subunit AcrA (membrane-fusion protein)
MIRPLLLSLSLLTALSLAGCARSTALPVGSGAGIAETSPCCAGRIRPAVRWVQGFDVDGSVRKVHVLPGDRVAVGQLLAELDDQPFAEVERGEMASLQQARSRLEDLGNYMRPEDVRLFSPGLAGGTGAGDSLRAAALDAEIARATAMTRVWHARLSSERARLHAAARGRVAAIEVVAGQPVSAGRGLFVLEDDDFLEVVAHVRGDDSGAIRPGQRAIVQRKADGAMLHGRVVRVGTGALAGAREVVVAVVERAVLQPGEAVRVGFPGVDKNLF